MPPCQGCRQRSRPSQTKRLNDARPRLRARAEVREQPRDGERLVGPVEPGGRAEARPAGVARVGADAAPGRVPERVANARQEVLVGLELHAPEALAEAVVDVDRTGRWMRGRARSSAAASRPRARCRRPGERGGSGSSSARTRRRPSRGSWRRRRADRGRSGGERRRRSPAGCSRARRRGNRLPALRLAAASARAHDSWPTLPCQAILHFRFDNLAPDMATRDKGLFFSTHADSRPRSRPSTTGTRPHARGSSFGAWHRTRPGEPVAVRDRACAVVSPARSCRTWA